jgi:hypothetical protein
MLITNEKTNSDYSHCYPTVPIMDRVGVEFNSKLKRWESQKSEWLI